MLDLSPVGPLSIMCCEIFPYYVFKLFFTVPWKSNWWMIAYPVWRKLSLIPKDCLADRCTGRYYVWLHGNCCLDTHSSGFCRYCCDHAAVVCSDSPACVKYFLLERSTIVLHIPRRTDRHRGNTLFCRVVTSILSQRLLHKMTNSRAVFIARIHARQTSKLSQETQYLASILSDTFVEYICRNIRCALGEWSLQLKVKFISTFTEFTRPWWRTLTNSSDVKYLFPRCRTEQDIPPPSPHEFKAIFVLSSYSYLLNVKTYTPFTPTSVGQVERQRNEGAECPLCQRSIIRVCSVHVQHAGWNKKEKKRRWFQTPHINFKQIFTWVRDEKERGWRWIFPQITCGCRKVPILNPGRADKS